MSTASTAKPKSATSKLSYSLGFIAYLVCLLCTKFVFQFSEITAILFLIIATAAVNFSSDLFLFKVHRRESTGLNWGKSTPSFSRFLTKYLGFVGSIGLVGLLYWIFPEYHGDFYDRYWTLLQTVLPFLCALAIPYIWYVDSRMKKPIDGYYQVGLLFMLRFENIDWPVLHQHLLGWLVKGFFLPLMVTYFINDLTKFVHFDLSEVQNFRTFYSFAFDSIFLVDVGFATLGYIMSLRLFDTHLRSAEPTMKGWMVALLCYQPFWGLFGRLYLDYSKDTAWGDWLIGSPVLYCIWGSTILLLYCCYTFSTITFGCRFSNLTHRGIITSGPYRWTKHPAYLTKNIAWWMSAVPFVASPNLAGAARACIMLAIVNFVYYMRAKTEEAHLMRDPDYQKYAAWIAQNGLFARLKSKT